MTHFRICCSYYFGEWSTCSEGGLWPFLSLHLTTNGYPYHHRWFLDFDGCCHCWPDAHRYGVANIDDDNTCNDNACSWEDMILCWANTKWWFHSLWYWKVWVFSFLFWFIFDHLCIDHYHASLAVFFNPFNVCFSLFTVSAPKLHNKLKCESKVKTSEE
jgi:hypothetical protein